MSVDSFVRLGAVAIVSLLAADITYCNAAWGAPPPDTVWLNAVHLQPAGPAELRFGYRFADAATGGFDRHRVQLGAAVGLDRGPVDVLPRIDWVQEDGGSTQLDRFGTTVRLRLAGTPGDPTMVAQVGYGFVPSSQFHRIDVGLTGRLATGGWAFAAGANARTLFAGDRDFALEVDAGVAATYGVALNLLRAGLETFAVIALDGARIIDEGQGEDPEGVAWYIGPTLRVHAESFWVGVGVATGALAGEGAPFLLRTTVAIQL